MRQYRVSRDACGWMPWWRWVGLQWACVVVQVGQRDGGGGVCGDEERGAMRYAALDLFRLSGSSVIRASKPRGSIMRSSLVALLVLCSCDGGFPLEAAGCSAAWPVAA